MRARVAAVDRPAGAVGWIARLLRAEDVAVTLLALVGLPLLDALTGRPSAPSGPADAPTPLVGLTALVGIVGVLVVLLSRGPDEPAPLAGSTMTLQGWARFPLAAGVAIVAVDTLPAIGLSDGPFGGLAFLAAFVGAIAHPRLPVVPVVARRLLVLPMTFIAAGAFDRIMGDGLGEIVGGFVDGSAPPELLAFAPIVVGAAATMYVMLVVAPRSIADPGASWLAWVVRFVLLLAAVAIPRLFGA